MSSVPTAYTSLCVTFQRVQAALSQMENQAIWRHARDNRSTSAADQINSYAESVFGLTEDSPAITALRRACSGAQSGQELQSLAMVALPVDGNVNFAQPGFGRIGIALMVRQQSAMLELEEETKEALQNLAGICAEKDMGLEIIQTPLQEMQGGDRISALNIRVLPLQSYQPETHMAYITAPDAQRMRPENNNSEREQQPLRLVQ